MKNKFLFILPLLILCLPLSADTADIPSSNMLFDDFFRIEGFTFVLIWLASIACAIFSILSTICLYLYALFTKRKFKIPKRLIIIFSISILTFIFTIAIFFYRGRNYVEKHINDLPRHPPRPAYDDEPAYDDQYTSPSH